MDAETSRAAAGPDEQIIRTVVSHAQESQSDTDSLMALHTPETVIVNVAGRRVFGRKAFAEAMVGALASPLREVRTTVEVCDVRFVTPDVAIVSCVKTVHDGRADADISAALPTAGALTYVMTKTEGSWRIALAQTTPSLAAGGADS